MSWQTHTFTITIRNLARFLGLTRFASYFLVQKDYEAAFDTAMFQQILLGDNVWDIGANVGHYTTKFAQQVGPTGQVIAFEPFPQTFLQLSKIVSGLCNVKLLQLGIGQENAVMGMLDVGETDGVTNRIVDEVLPSGTNVEITTADYALKNFKLPLPNVVKIDTEGFELDVLIGMSNLLSETELRAIFIEIHFSLLNERGQPSAPAVIEKMLVESGFKVNWTDPSHIEALRYPAYA